MKKITIDSPKYGTFKVLVDDEGFEYLSKFNWTINKQRGHFYARRSGKLPNGKRFSPLMHREIMKITDPKTIVDHKDLDTFNNQKVNLRVATLSQNGSNTCPRKKSTSKYLGVSWWKRENKWRAALTKNKKTIHLGGFKNEIDAAKAYDKAAKLHHGEFANLNFKG